MNIRFAEEKDFNSCVELDLHKNVNIIKNKIHMKEVIVAEHNNKIIGCLKIEYIWTHLPFISYIVIKKDYRANGIGKSMLSFLENYLKEEDQMPFINLMAEKNYFSKEGIEAAIDWASRKQKTELLSILMNEQHKRFPKKKKTFEL